MINDLLDLSRLETGADVPQFIPIDLNTWLPERIHSFTERAHTQQQLLQLETPRLPPMLTDPSRLDRVLGELLNNACKYTPAGGAIVVSLRLMHAFASNQAQILQISICNSGVEISPEELTKIFDKFYRIPNNDPWKHGGTGLGLALVKKLVELLDGTIQATSSKGTTCFVVQLPFQAVENTYAGDTVG